MFFSHNKSILNANMTVHKNVLSALLNDDDVNDNKNINHNISNNNISNNISNNNTISNNINNDISNNNINNNINNTISNTININDQCSTTGLPKAVVCMFCSLSEIVCIKKTPCC